MRIGSRTRPQGGFTYIGLLLFVAITGAALAALGQAWTTAVQREKERELEFRGQEIASAIQSYRLASPAQANQPPQYPRSLDDLLVDARGLKPRHHLRRLYPDPLTGKADWVLIPDPANPQAFHGLRSRSEQQLMRRQRPDGTPLLKASEWVFLAQDGAPAAPAQGASAPDGKASGIP
ncbi:MAG: type II secretion system protein [Burkholderiaceae bacterium]|nr:type II secretion system protein [Burkholderiaceae bacterium]